MNQQRNGADIEAISDTSYAHGEKHGVPVGFTMEFWSVQITQTWNRPKIVMSEAAKLFQNSRNRNEAMLGDTLCSFARTHSCGTTLV
jgi:hypothetical protein